MKKQKQSQYQMQFKAIIKRLEELCPGCDYGFRYTLDAQNNPSFGYGAYRDGVLYLLDDIDAELRSVKLDSFSEIKCQQHFGCAALEVVTEKGEVELCRGDMSCILGLQAIAKRITLIKEGRRPDTSRDLTEKSCHKCGRPYPRGSTVCADCVDKKNLIKKVLPYLKPYMLPLVLSLLAFVVASAITAFLPLLNRSLINDYIKNDNPETVVFNAFITLIITIAVVELALRFINIFRAITIAKVGNKIAINIKNALFSKIQQLSLSGIGRRSAGELINRITEDANLVQEFLTDTVPVLIQQTLNLFAIGTIVFIMDWKLALMIIFPMPLIAILFYSMRSFMGRIYHRQWQASSDSNTILHDIFQGIRVVKSFGMETYEFKRFDKTIKKLSDISAKNEVLWQTIMPPLNFFMGIGEYFIFAYAGMKIIGGTMEFGDMNAFLSYAAMLYGPLRWIAFLPRRLSRQMTSIAKVFEIMDEEPEIVDTSKPVETKLKGDIEFKNAYFSYNGYEYVVKNIDLKIKRGDMIGIVGRSGVGKSTLINLVMRLYDLNEGTLAFDGVDVRDIPQHTLRSQIGVVLQETFLFRGTIFNNIAYADPKASPDEVIRAAKLANAHQFIMKLPDGYNTLVGERGQTLSGGERQRIAIARAVLRNPEILILDEATASLDTETEKLIQDSIAALTKNRTTIAIAHRLSTLRNATRLVVLEKNEIEEEGTHEELLKKNGRYSKLVMAQRQMSKLANKK